jgi:DNA-binding MarR family transcriptional regulator
LASSADPRPEALLDLLEVRLLDGLREDAKAVQRMEASARLLLALAPPEGVSMRELARRIRRDPSTVTRFVHRAVVEGLVEQRPGTGDRRTRLLHLTAEGRAQRERLVKRRAARAEALREGVSARTGLGADEVEWFLTAVLEALGGGPGERRPRGA